MSNESKSSDLGPAPMLSEADTRKKENAEVALKVAAAKRIIIAIHGIGDQYQNATVKTVLSAVGKFFGYPAATPIGRFRSPDGRISAFTLPQLPPPAEQLPPALAETGFVEIYWANLPRAIRRRGYIIEESKAWARTIVDRVRARYGAIAARPPHPPSARSKQARASSPTK